MARTRTLVKAFKVESSESVTAAVRHYYRVCRILATGNPELEVVRL